MSHIVMIIDNRTEQQRLVELALRQKLGYQTIHAESSEYAIRWVLSRIQPQPDIILIDVTGAADEISKTIRQIKAFKPQLPIIMLTPYGDDEQAVPAITAGADDFLSKPVSLERLKLSLRNCLKTQQMNNVISRLERHNNGHMHFCDIVGHNEALVIAMSAGEMASMSKIPVWIEGEPGTGKEMFARAIHGGSSRAGKPFVVVDCESFAADKAETLLFGQEKHSGAPSSGLGKLREADGGTIYLREVSKLSPYLQLRLLTFFEEEQVLPQGAFSPVPVNCRIICSNSKHTDTAVIMFNAQLHRHLKGIEIGIPSLRDRRQDVGLLSRHFLSLYASSQNKYPMQIADDALQALENHPWPGNVRQLAHLLHRTALLCRQDTVDAGTLRLVQQLEPVNYARADGLSPVQAPAFFDMQGKFKKLRSIEEDAIRFALRHSGGCMTKAARNLGIGRSTLYRKIDEMGPDNYILRENHTTRPMISASSGKLS